ncbi:sensor domain-containing diguanylate cyclase [Inhella proteolytica]|uniref:Diguanylate cyclase n=1 Tax=Inhella proteolytica TaxID=2795029 RepID=A0A931IYR7_9BURK|nr:diguanylate cyclase [Inhella proteolytica]MBH9576234.1 diguanylate cyclase [Inhella proteolytica]
MSNDAALPTALLHELLALRNVLDETGAYIFCKDLQGRYTYVNQLVLDLFGRSREQVLGHEDSEFFDLERSSQLREHDQQVMRTGEPIEQEELNYVRETGEQRIYWTVKKPVRDPEGHIVGLCGISTDITERKRIEAQLAEQHQLLQTVLAHVDAHIYMKDDQRRFQYVNAKTAALFQRPAADIIGRRDIEVLKAETADALWDMDRQVFESGRPQSGEETIIDAEGRSSHYWTVKVPLKTEAGHRVLIGFSSDITELVRLREQLRQQSVTDSLTGLANRRHFVTTAETELSRTQRHQRRISLVLLDIDQFKAINDRHGHSVGDDALRALAEALRPLVRREDLLARVGGEEFAVLLPDTPLDAAALKAEQLRAAVQALRIPTPQGSQLQLSISLGVAQTGPSCDALTTLYATADRRLYRAKHLGRNQVCVEDASEPPAEFR